MDRYEKSADKIMERGDKLIAEKTRRAVMIKRTAFASSGLCAAVIAGYGIWSNTALKNAIDRTPSAEYESNIIAETTISDDEQEKNAATTALISTTMKHSESVQTTVLQDDVLTTAVTSASVAATNSENEITSFDVIRTTESHILMENSNDKSVYVTPVQETTEPVTEQTTEAVSIIQPTKYIEEISYGVGDFSYTNLYKILSAERVGAELGRISIESHTDAVIYEIKETPTETAVALKLSDSDDYTVFSNSFYRFTDSESGIQYTKLNEKLSPQIVGSFIKMEALSEQIAAADIDLNTNSEIFSLNGIVPEAMIGVRYEGQEDLMLYRNQDYMPETLGEFIDDLGMRKYAVFNSAEYFDYSNGYQLFEYYDFDDSIINYLFDNTQAKCYNYGDLYPDQIVTKLNLVCELPDILSFKVGFGISKKGYVTTNLTGGGLAFDIGEDKAAELIGFITENYPYSVVHEDIENDRLEDVPELD